MFLTVNFGETQLWTKYYRDGHLQEGDQILAIDGQPLDSNISHQQAISILQQARGLVELVVARGGILTNAEQTPSVSIERSPSAVSANSKTSDMVLNTEWAQVESIDLINDGGGLGFGIIGGRSTGVVVKTILPGGVADRDGRLQSGDHILQIGEVNLRGMGSEQVAMVLRQSGSHVRLIVARPVDPTSPDYHSLRSNAPIVPTRILVDAEEVERHLAMFQQTQNGFPEPLPYKGPPDVDASFIYQRELNGTDEFYNSAFLPSSVDLSSAAKLSRGAEQEAGDDLPEMETFEVELVKDQQGLGITIAGYVCEKEEISGIFVKSIAKGSAADMCGQIRVNDQIIEVDGRSLHGYTNHQAVEVLRNTGKAVKLRLARYLRGTKYQQLQQAIASGELSYPNPVAQAQVHEPKSLLITEAANKDVDVTDFSHQINDNYEGPLDSRTESAIQAKWSKMMGPEYEIIVAQLSKFREGGGLGISLEGTVDVEDGKEVRPHHYIRSILPDGPVGVNGRLHGGDELLEVNGVKLLGMNHHGVVATLKELPMHVRMVCARRLLPSDRGVVIPSLGDADSSHPYHKLDYDLSTMPEFPERGMLSGPFGGSLTSLTPVSERLVKAKSDGSLAVGTSASSSPPVEVTLSKLKSRSLEPLTGLAMWSSEPQIIELIKGDRGLGFSILDYQDPMNPNETVIVIRSLVPGGVAQQDGRLIPGDRLLFVNDINLENASLDAAVQALKGAPKGVVRIGVAKPLPLPESSQSGQVTWEVGSGISDLSRKPSFELPPHIQSHGMDSDQPSSLPAKILPDVELKSPSTVNKTSQVAKANVSSTTAAESAHDTLAAPSTEQISKLDIAPFPQALERTARVKKGSDILGLQIDVLEAIGGVVVSSVAPESAVAKDGRIEPGDFMLSVNGSSFVNATVEEAARILHSAEKLNTDILIKYVPAADAAVHHQSALMSMNRESELLTEVARAPEFQSESIAVESRPTEEEEDLDQPPDTPPPPPPPLSFAGLEEEGKEESRIRPKSSIFDKNIMITKTEPTVSIVQPVSSVSTFKPFKATVSVPLFEERKPVLSAQLTKPAVPLKPMRSSLLSPFDIPVREKSKISTIEGLTGETTMVSRQWGPERTVELNRDPSKGLGISIISGKTESSHGGIYIKNVLPDSPAGWNGTLKRGDRILEVSGIDLRNATHAKAVEVIKNAQNPVVFVVQSLVVVPKKVESELSSPETKAIKLPHSPLTEHTSAVTSSSSHIQWSPAAESGFQFKDKSIAKYPPVTHGLSPTEQSNRVKSSDREPPAPPPRTVSRMPKIPSPSTDEEQQQQGGRKIDAEETLPQAAVSHSIQTQGKVLTKKGVEIDFGSAGNVKMSADEQAEGHAEEEDEFGYTSSKPFVFTIR